MARKISKQFEAKFSEQWAQQFPDSVIYRLPDQMSEYADSTNPCDFFCFIDGKLLMVETKTHEGNTINIRSDIPQYHYLLEYLGKPGVYPVIVIWFLDHDKIVYIKEEDMKRLVEDGLKSVNITRKHELEKYNVVEIPSERVRKFMKSDYTVLANIV